MAKKFSELESKMSPARRARVRARVEKALKEMPLKEMPLDELREARAMTQAHLATILQVKQPEVSKMERRADMYVSTLRDVIRAMGGRLELRAVFPDGAVRISQFGELEATRHR